MTRGEHRCVAVLVYLCLFPFLSCSKYESIDLTGKLRFTERVSDTTVLLFGTPRVEDNLISGWSAPDIGPSGKFRWATSNSASFTWEPVPGSKPYLHLRFHSTGLASFELFSGGQFVSRVPVESGQQHTLVPLPSGSREATIKMMHQTSLGVYVAVITPSRYVPEYRKPKDFPFVDKLKLRNKSYPSWFCETGGTISFYDYFNPEDDLEFGIFFSPSDPDEDDFADFTVTLRSEKGPDRKLFEKKVTKRIAEFFKIPLALPVTGGRGPAMLEFRIARNTAFGRGQAGWVQPRLRRIRRASEPAKESPDAAAVRRSARNAGVVLIVLDAASAGHFGCYGYAGNTTPVVDRLASEGVLFRRAYTNAAYTLASTATLFTGQFPHRHGILQHRNKLPGSAVTLAETLRSAGYDTAAFLANGNASGIFGLAQGFNTVRDVFRDRNYIGWGEDVTESFVKWLGERREKKFFAYLHYREPHDPYNPPEEWIHRFADPSYDGSIGESFESRIRIDTNSPELTSADRKRVKGLYDSNLAYADHQVGRIIRELKASGMFDSTIIIVTSDHGEAFWEHGYQGHNQQLYEESVRIPFVLKLPGKKWNGKIVDSTVQTADVVPFLLDVLGLPDTGNIDGRSFLSAIDSPGPDLRPVIVYSTKQQVTSMLLGSMKYIRNSTTDEFYDLKKDPAESFNSIETNLIRAGYLAQKLRESAEPVKQKREKGELPVLDEAARENLKALGYIE